MESAYHVRILEHSLHRSATRFSRQQLVLVATLSALAPASFLTPLAPAAESNGQITGRVTDASTEAPIAGVEVCALTKANEPGENDEEGLLGGKCENTGTNGEYTIPGLTSGEYVIAFGSPFMHEQLNYVTQFYNDKPTASQANLVSVAAGSTTSGINAKLEEGGRIAGKVTDTSNGSAISGVGVCASEANPEIGGCASTNSNGEYTISGLAAGVYKVEFIRPEYVTQYYDDKPTLSEASPVAVVVGETASGIDAALQPKPPEPPEDKTLPKVIVSPPTEGGPEAFQEGPMTEAPPTVGSTLLCFKGVWTGIPKPTFTYTWLRDGRPIAGATETKYLVQAADAGHALACRVTAKNSQGEASATSASVTIAGGGASGGGGASHTTDAAHITVESAMLMKRARAVRVALRCGGAPCKGSIALRALVTSGRRARGPNVQLIAGPVLAKGSFSLAENESTTILVRLTPMGRRRLAHAGRHPLPIQFVISIVGGHTKVVLTGRLGGAARHRASRRTR
jgi:hypothetical protein